MYLQHNDVAIGIHLHPAMADIFITHSRTALLDELIGMVVCKWHQYVDDTFVLVQLNINVVSIFAVLNGVHPSIKFMYETETSNCRPLI
jgi:hypothetical protein